MISQSELKQLLSSKFNFEVWKPILDQMFLKIDYLTKEIQIDASLVKSGGQIGTIRLDDGRSLGLFKFEVADRIIIARNRKGLREIAAKYVDQDIIHGALVFYYSTQQPDYRLTFVSKQTVINANGEVEKKETAPKRYTFLLGENEPCTTAASRLHELISKSSVYLADVTDAFSVERLNKEFFKAYKEQYQKFLKYLNADTKANRDYVKKLLGRLVFLHFLQKKGWMGVPLSNPKWEGGDKAYLLHLVERNKGNNRLLTEVLEKLFFKTLNEKRTDDKADPLLGDNIKIPYLNGGLFDEDSLDKQNIDFPYAYFKDLMEFFAWYNFTIDENDPDDSEIGIDPEMLGHIFENLLEDNKDKGAFYTPKEIVQYMSRESVCQYLRTCTPEDLHAAIDTLVKQKQVEPLLQNRENARLVNRALETVKVCDPAIGSGAFPMGVLNVLFDCRHLLYGFIGENKPFSYADIKKQIIQNNIYGVDIEQGAVDIARLRFWLALVVDENEPQPLPNLDYKIMCGDSLLHRFALDAPFQDVLKDYNREYSTNYTLEDYRQWVYAYTNISDHTQKDDFRNRIEEIKHAFKTELSKKEKTKIAKVRGAIANLQMEDLFGSNPKDKEKELKKLQKQLKALEQQRDEIESNKIYEHAFEWRFEFPALLDSEGNFTGFDIVIGNPPYNELRDLDISTQNALKESSYFEYAKGGRLNVFQFFYPLTIEIAKELGIISIITQNSILSEESTLGNRRLFMSRADILAIDSFPERDNVNTRVFESVKMSVCICTLKKKVKPNDDLIIPITVWHTRFMQENHKLYISKKEIRELFPTDLIFPISTNKKLDILKKVWKRKNYTIKASAGEIDMTKYSAYFNVIHIGKRILTGAQVQRYSISDSPSQGDVIYLEEKYINLSPKRCAEIQFPRIVLQRITGVDSKIRIIATYTEQPILCANSTNYIPYDESINMLYLLAIINSALTNFYIKQTSTNTNITTKVLESIPIAISDITNQTLISTLVTYILFLKSTEQISNLVSNRYIAQLVEDIINLCIYEIYFPDYMLEENMSILNYLEGVVSTIDNQNETDTQKIILNFFEHIKKTDNPVRNSLDKLKNYPPELLSLIIKD